MIPVNRLLLRSQPFEVAELSKFRRDRTRQLIDAKIQNPKV